MCINNLFFPIVTGIYTSGHLVDVEIIFPRRVTHNGELISYNVTHHQGNNTDQDLHLRLTRANNEYHLHLTPVVDFISPKIIIEKQKKNIHVRHSVKTFSKCHYRGYIRGQINSRVALSACNGLVSFFIYFPIFNFFG